MRTKWLMLIASTFILFSAACSPQQDSQPTRVSSESSTNSPNPAKPTTAVTPKPTSAFSSPSETADTEAKQQAAQEANSVTQPTIAFTDSTGTEISITSTQRIIPVDGDLTEVVFALGLGSQVVAVDISATFPPSVSELPVIGYQRTLNAEPILKQDPSIVIATDIAGPPETLQALRDIGIPVIVFSRDPSLNGPAQKIRDVASALGQTEKGEELAQLVQQQIDEARRESSATETPLKTAVFYLRGDNAQLMLGSDFTIHSVLKGIGTLPIAELLGVESSQPITEEALLVANPDVIIVTTTGLESVGGIDGLLQNPAIAHTNAGKNRRIFAFEDQYLLGGGPRTGKLMTEIASKIYNN